MRRTRNLKFRLTKSFDEQEDRAYMLSLTPGERFKMTFDVSRTAWAFSNNTHDADQRIQRDVGGVYRRGR
jgi:hypothetical protein